jgi:ABC-2 type transport system ATP-binding protein
MSEPAIQIENLTKFYDGRKILDDVSIAIPKGCIFGLLGRNGVGKTTLIRILMGQEKPTRGQTLINGVPSWEMTAAQKGKIGYVAEGHNLIQNYKVARLVDICKSLSLKWDQQFFDKLIKTFRLPMDRKVKQLSTGMRAQLNLALAMAIEPEILILDDPTLGLDTVARRHFLELAIDVIQKDGRAVLFSSHILSDVERIADRVGFIVNGKLVVDCGVEELKRRIQKIRVIFPDDAPENLHLTDIISQKNSGREVFLTIANWGPQKSKVIETFGPETIEEIPMSLEDMFIECTNPGGILETK